MLNELFGSAQLQQIKVRAIWLGLARVKIVGSTLPAGGDRNLKKILNNFIAILCDSKHFLFSFLEKKEKKIDPSNLFYPKSYYFCD
jgi:hypothetical protein